jgi:methionyl-tRNA synthetase
MAKPFFVTTSIPYVNAIPHIGHATEFVMTDIIARYARLTQETYFLSGTDENALKNVQAAEKAGIPVEEFVKEHSQSFFALGEMLDISFDQFIRTATPEHFGGAQKLWSEIVKRNPDDIYTKSYEGLYCVGCEEFKTEKDLVDGLCPDHQTAPEHIHEQNYFFRLSKYQDQLLELFENGTIQVFPEFRKKEVESFIRMGLEDFSLSRSQSRAKGWGVPVPGDDTQIMYVWVDALSNYITALDYEHEGELYKTFWEGQGDRVHVIGKGILRFHAIYWPAMLLSAGLPLPTRVLSHEYITINDQKVSKSLGNVINPGELVERYGCDGTRFVLISSLPSTRDGDVSWQKMDALYNSELANGLGNLVSRVIKLSEQLTSLPNVTDIRGEQWSEPEQAMLFDILISIMSRVRVANKYMDETKPWVLVKEDKAAFEGVIQNLFEQIAVIADELQPFMPSTAAKIQTALKTGEVTPLFQRLSQNIS